MFPICEAILLFSSESFIVLTFIFRSKIDLELVSVFGEKRELRFICLCVCFLHIAFTRESLQGGNT